MLDISQATDERESGHHDPERDMHAMPRWSRAVARGVVAALTARGMLLAAALTPSTEQAELCDRFSDMSFAEIADHIVHN